MNRLLTFFLAAILLTGCASMAEMKTSKVSIGMTEQQVIEKIGHPLRVKTTRTANGKKEQWVYDKAWLMQSNPYEREYIYIRDGEVVATQN